MVDSLSGVSKLVKSGDDIKGPGLFEYMFDCVYLTWFCDILMIVFGSNKVWIIMLTVPAFLIYKISSIAKSFFGGKKVAAAKVSTANEDSQGKHEGKSKRQAKLEQRGQRTQRFNVR